jgi:hypothetical protein
MTSRLPRMSTRLASLRSTCVVWMCVDRVWTVCEGVGGLEGRLENKNRMTEITYDVTVAEYEDNVCEIAQHLGGRWAEGGRKVGRRWAEGEEKVGGSKVGRRWGEVVPLACVPSL